MNTGIACVAVLLLVASPGRIEAQTTIPNRASCAACRITLTRTNVIGTADGPGSLVGPPKSVAVDGAGQLWLGFWVGESTPLIFDRHSRFVRSAGRKGSGPGEFRAAEIVASLPGDSMLVIDMRNASATILTHQGEVARSVRMPGVQISSIVVDWPRIVVSAPIRTSRSVGWPLHVIDLSTSSGKVVRSFGHNAGRMTAMDVTRHQAILAAGRQHVISVDELEYRITRWQDGQATSVYLRRPSWFANRSTGLPGGPRRPGSPRIAAATVDESGLLWVFAHVAAPDYAEHWSALEQPQRPQRRGVAESGDFEIPAMDALYDTIVEVIDLENATVVHSTRIPIYVHGVLSDGRVYGARETPDGVPILDIWSKNLIR